jgi:threonine aldolase
VIAAAGLVAVETMVERLADDHRAARELAEGLQGIPGVTIDLARVQTNMVFLELEGARTEVARLNEAGVRCNAMGAREIRLVTHFDLNADDLRRGIERIRAVLGG